MTSQNQIILTKNIETHSDVSQRFNTSKDAYATFDYLHQKAFKHGTDRYCN